MGTARFWMLGCLLLAGCAANSVVVEPGSLPLVPMESRAEQKEAPLWVSGARDVRPADRAGPKLGTLYTRIQRDPLAAFLDRNPEVYVKEQLGRFLFNRRLEAPGAGAARVFAAIELEEFSATQLAGALWSEITVRVAYTVRLTDPAGNELGKVRLEGSAESRTPFAATAQVEKALRIAVTDTFEAFVRSPVLKSVLEGVKGS